MSGGEDLYQQAIKDWAQADHGHGRLDPADAAARADNPLCGDRVQLTVRLDAERIAALAQETRGCLLCRAAASLLALRAPGMDAAAAAAATTALEALLTDGSEPPPAWQELGMFAPARTYRSRHKCVLLPFRALRQALEGVSQREQ